MGGPFRKNSILSIPQKALPVIRQDWPSPAWKRRAYLLLLLYSRATRQFSSIRARWLSAYLRRAFPRVLLELAAEEEYIAVAQRIRHLSHVHAGVE